MHRHAIEYSRLIHNKSITVKYNTILHHNYNTNNSPYSYDVLFLYMSIYVAKTLCCIYVLFSNNFNNNEDREFTAKTNFIFNK